MKKRFTPAQIAFALRQAPSGTAVSGIARRMGASGETLREIARHRLANQQISDPVYAKVDELVRHLGALQAQDYDMAKWAIGKRLPGATDESVESAMTKGEILRTHLLRPTWHIVAADDIQWLLALTAPHIASSLKSRHDELGLSRVVIKRCNAVIEKGLARRGALTREEIALLLRKSRIATKDNNRLSHILLCAELDGVICSGPRRGKSLTYALLAERVRSSVKLSNDEALGEIARRYFVSRGPATLKDFIWWSGLSAADAKKALAIAGTSLRSETVDSAIYWFPETALQGNARREEVHLLPAYDEFLIAYRDRTASLPMARLKRAVSSNGIFRPTVVIEGEVAGLWKRTTGSAKVTLEVELFHAAGRKIVSSLTRESRALASFLKKEVDLIVG
jgi:hypothetical protein